MKLSAMSTLEYATVSYSCLVKPATCAGLDTNVWMLITRLGVVQVYIHCECI